MSPYRYLHVVSSIPYILFSFFLPPYPKTIHPFSLLSSSYTTHQHPPSSQFYIFMCARQGSLYTLEVFSTVSGTNLGFSMYFLSFFSVES